STPPCFTSYCHIPCLPSFPTRRSSDLCAAAHAVKPGWIGVAGFDEEFRAIDEVREGVFLLQELAVFIPGAAELLPATDVGDRIHEPTVEQAQAGGAEGRVEAVAVRAVAVEQKRRGAVDGRLLSADERDRNASAVAGRGIHPLGHVVGRIESARHLI